MYHESRLVQVSLNPSVFSVCPQSTIIAPNQRADSNYGPQTDSIIEWALKLNGINVNMMMGN